MNIKHYLAAFIVLASSNAMADWKSYPGSFCEGVDGTLAAPHDEVGRVVNTSTNRLTFVCGAVKDRDNITEARVNVFDASGSDNVSCRLEARNADGSLAQRGDPVESRGLGIQTLQFPAISARPSLGYYLVRCHVPARTSEGNSRINSYAVQEN